MYRIQFYPNKALADILASEATTKGVSVSQLLNDLLEEFYGISSKTNISITQLTVIVLKEVEEYVRMQAKGSTFDLNTASTTYRTISMTCGKAPSTVRAIIGRSFAAKIGKAPFQNVHKYIVNGKQHLSTNNALVYEIF